MSSPLPNNKILAAAFSTAAAPTTPVAPRRARAPPAAPRARRYNTSTQTPHASYARRTLFATNNKDDPVH